MASASSTVNTTLPCRRGALSSSGGTATGAGPTACRCPRPPAPFMRQSLSGRSGLRPRRRVPRSTYSEPVSEKNETKPHTQGHDQPVPEAYATFMRQGWGDRELDLPPHPVAPWAAQRRAQLAETFPGERLVIPAGNFKVRANDTDYRFRPDTAHTYLCGNQTSDAVLVVEDGEEHAVTRGPAPRGRPTSSSGTVSTASCGPAGAPRSTRSRPRSASPSATSTSSARCSAPPPRPACCAASTRRSTAPSPPTRAATRTSPGCSRRCGSSRTTGSSSSSPRPATSPRSGSPTASASGTTC